MNDAPRLLSPAGAPARNERVLQLHGEIQVLALQRDAVLRAAKLQGTALQNLIETYNAEIQRRGQELGFLGEKQAGGQG